MTTEPVPDPGPRDAARTEPDADADRRPPPGAASAGPVAGQDEPVPTLLQRAKALWCAFVSGLG